TICAPMFSNLSSSSISLATVTPSLVMRGAPKLLSSTTLRPFGPSVTFTALARVSTPRNILSRASTENLTSLAAISRLQNYSAPRPEERAKRASRRTRARRVGASSFETPRSARLLRMRVLFGSGGLLGRHLVVEDSEDVGLLHDEQIFAVDFHFSAGPLAEQH